jgi:hypothetical protein
MGAQRFEGFLVTAAEMENMAVPEDVGRQFVSELLDLRAAVYEVRTVGAKGAWLRRVRYLTDEEWNALRPSRAR